MTATLKSGRKWKLLSSAPITGESRRGVYCEEDGEEGWRSVRWVEGHPQLYGPVYVGEPHDSTVVDFHPAELRNQHGCPE